MADKWYKCGVCGYESRWRIKAEICEASHQTNETKAAVSLALLKGGASMDDHETQVYCMDCGTACVARVELTDAEYADLKGGKGVMITPERWPFPTVVCPQCGLEYTQMRMPIGGERG